MSKNPQSFLDLNWWTGFVEAIGNWNPQLLYELKSRVNLRNVVLGGLLSIGLQLCSIAGTSSWLNASIDRHNSYYELPWMYVTAINCYIIFVLMATVGVYFIASSFRQEQRQGTLDFLRLAPQTAAAILMGKLLGAPSLVYWAGICALPLQLYGAQVAKISLLTILIWDFEILGLLAMFYLSAALLTLWFETLPMLLALATCGFSLLIIFINFLLGFESGSVQWYGISWSDPLMTFFAIAILAGMALYWLAQILERTYDRAATLLNRGQSYLWSLNYHVFLLGLCITSSPHGNGGIFGLSFNAALQTYQSIQSVHPIDGKLPGFFWSMLSFWLLCLIPLLLPNVRTSIGSSAKQGVSDLSWWKTMLFDDLSPSILAVLVNLGIAISVWSIPVLAMLPTIDTKDTSIEERSYSVSSLGINFPFWLSIIFSLMFVWSTIDPHSFRRISSSPLWVAVTISVIIYPTLYWTVCGSHPD
jgi:ABC-type transport system involved in cytochrome c biogenesis permease component